MFASQMNDALKYRSDIAVLSSSKAWYWRISHKSYLSCIPAQWGGALRHSTRYNRCCVFEFRTFPVSYGASIRLNCNAIKRNLLVTRHNFLSFIHRSTNGTTVTLWHFSFRICNQLQFHLTGAINWSFRFNQLKCHCCTATRVVNSAPPSSK